MFKKIRQYSYIRKIRKEIEQNSPLRFLSLNSYRNQAAFDLLGGRISMEFYNSIFCGGDARHHYTEINAEAIKNYKF